MVQRDLTQLTKYWEDPAGARGAWGARRSQEEPRRARRGQGEPDKSPAGYRRVVEVTNDEQGGQRLAEGVQNVLSYVQENCIPSRDLVELRGEIKESFNE